MKSNKDPTVGIIMGSKSDWKDVMEHCSHTLKEFGINIDNNVRIQVHDSTADMRYIVLPKIPNNMVGKIDDISMEEIESIITRDCMIGTDVPVYVENEKL